MSDKWVSSSKFNTQRQKPELKIIGEQFIFQKLKKNASQFSIWVVYDTSYNTCVSFLCLLQVITHMSQHWLMSRKTLWSTSMFWAGQWSSTTIMTSFGLRPIWTVWSVCLSYYCCLILLFLSQFNKWNSYLKTVFYIYWFYLCLIFFDDLKHVSVANMQKINV